MNVIYLILGYVSSYLRNNKIKLDNNQVVIKTNDCTLLWYSLGNLHNNRKKKNIIAAAAVEGGVGFDQKNKQKGVYIFDIGSMIKREKGLELNRRPPPSEFISLELSMSNLRCMHFLDD